MKLFFSFFLGEGPGFLVVVVFLAGTVEEVAAGRLRAGRAVAGGGGGVGAGGWRGVLGSRLSPDCTIRFHPLFQSRAHQILVLLFLIHCHAWPFSPGNPSSLKALI